MALEHSTRQPVTFHRKPVEEIKTVNHWGKAKQIVDHNRPFNREPLTEIPSPDGDKNKSWYYNKPRYEARVVKGATPDECYKWEGAYARQGHAVYPIKKGLTRDSNQTTAARLAMALELGRPLLPDEIVFAPVCNNPACTNPAHLSIGTKSDSSIHAQSLQIETPKMDRIKRLQYDKVENMDWFLSTNVKKLAKDLGMKIGSARWLQNRAIARHDFIHGNVPYHPTRRKYDTADMMEYLIKSHNSVIMKELNVSEGEACYLKFRARARADFIKEGIIPTPSLNTSAGS